jgi:hypothetical protein
MPGGPSAPRILALALALGWGTDALFYGKPLGISAPLFVLLLLGGLFLTARLTGARAVRGNLWLLGPLLFFAIMLFLRANTVLTLANSAAVLGLLGLLAYFFAAERLERLSLLGYPVALAITARHVLTAARPPVVALRQTPLARRYSPRALAPVVRGVVLATPVVLVFTMLFSSADLIFADYVGDFLQLQFLRSLPELLVRLALVLLAAWLIAGGLLFAVRRTGHSAGLPGSRLPDLSIGFMEGAIVLGLVDALFLVFAWFQFTYLFSGAAARTMHFEVYREYVRRGFGELLVVAVLTMVLILGLRWITWKETPRQGRLLNSLCTLMIGLALVLLVSAFMRMVIWESVQYYINTPLRLYVRWFIFWLGLAFVWLGYTVWWRPQRFAIGAFVATLGFLVSINAINPDADVARYNLARNDELSTRYLNLLSDDAVPVLVAGLDQTTGEVQRGLREHLGLRLAALENDPARTQWPAFHWAHWQAYELLTAARRAGKLAAGSPARGSPTASAGRGPVVSR